MKKVITYGTFDLLHYGHINLLRRAKELGDYLVVVVSSDEFNWNEKGKKCYFTYEQRKAMVEAIRYVDLVVPETNWEQKRTDVHEYDIDVFVMGDDWEGKFDFLKEEGVEVVYLPRTPEISTTQIKKDLNKVSCMADSTAGRKVTIVIPLYQVEDYIKPCLDSVAEQTYTGPIECIIVDDCGTDTSCQIVEKFISDYKGNIDFILLHHDHNRGLSAARNTGMDHASGEYIYFLDSDDEITPDCIEKLTNPLENYRYDFVIADFSIIGDRQVTTYLKARGEYKSGIKEAYYRKEWNVTAWNKLCNIDFLRRNNLRFKEGIIHEDILWSFYLANFAKSMYALKLKTYIYNTREDSIMGSMKLTKSKDSKLVIYSEVNRFLSQMESYSHDDLAYLWRIKREMFEEIRGWDLDIAKPYLLAIKKATIVNPIKAYRMKLLSLKELVKDLYMILPNNVSLFYCRLLNRAFKVYKHLV